MAKLWLHNQLCHTVDEEVKLNHLGLLRYCDLDNKKVIDVVGVGLKYFPWRRRKIQDEDYDGFRLDSPERYLIGYNVLRGVEVKVSRGDFRNGFACTGCNYNYVLTPTRLVSPSVVPRGVGLIEYNRYKFSCEATDDGPERRPFRLEGVRVVKPAQYRRLPQFYVDHVIAEMAYKRKASSETLAEVLRCLDDPELVYVH